jgi:hypothetical protein
MNTRYIRILIITMSVGFAFFIESNVYDMNDYQVLAMFTKILYGLGGYHFGVLLTNFLRRFNAVIE